MKHRQWQQRLLAVFLVVSLVLGSSVIEVRASQIEEETGDTVESEIDEAGQEQSIDENIEASETSEISDPETSVVEIQESEAIQDKVDHTEESEAETSEREDDNMSLIETETESVEEMAAEDAIILMDGEFVSLKNPRFELDSSMEAGRKITYDCVWFGSYPQREVVASASDSGVYGKSWAKADDYIVDATLYDELVKASYDTNGDTVVNGMKYRRITSRDATYWNNTSNGTDFYFNWSDAVTYRYFRFEPIKWRVLRVSGGKAFLLADQALDEQFYNLNDKNVTWKSSSIRSWLNGYGSTVNEPGKDYTTGSFIDSAFSSSEKKAIVTTDVVNEGNLFLKREGSKNTRDKLFLLSESEVYKTNTANSYGFISMEKYDDEARRSKSSTYAKAMGTSAGILKYSGNCSWWLRSPGNNGNSAVLVKGSGGVEFYGLNVNYGYSVRPALNMDLSILSWSYAGTVCTNGVVKEEACSHTHSYELTDALPASLTADGSKTYICSCGDVCQMTLAKIKSASLSRTKYTFDGKVKTPKVKVTDANGKVISSGQYTVKRDSGRKSVGEYTCTITFGGDYTGEISKVFTIVPKSTTIYTPVAGSKAFTVKWKKQATKMAASTITGYQIRYSTVSSMAGSRTKTVKGYTRTSQKIGSLKAKTKYYVQVRTYIIIDGKKYTSAWSEMKEVTTK